MKNRGLRTFGWVLMRRLSGDKGSPAGRKGQRKLLAAAAVLFLGFSGFAFAGFPQGNGGRGGSWNGVLEQLIAPCRAACRDTVRDCSTTAESDAVACLQDSCATETEAAQNACATDMTSDTCRTAVNVLRTCGSSCLTTLKSTITSCREAQKDCLDACETN